MEPLTVYKASAGAGKTFTLAVEYIKLLVKNPYSYRNILAVTFTNKATEEMKNRILSHLYGIWRRLPDSAGYYKKVSEGLPELSEEQITQRAGKALGNLLHNYNYFRVETIDTFFQSVMRNLARELDLTANLRIGLNDFQVEAQAVDEMIDGLDAGSTLLSWIMDYIRLNIAENKNWNIISQIKEFGKNIFKDFYKEHSKELNKRIEEKDFFEKFTSDMYALRTSTAEQLAALGDAFFDAVDKAGYSVDNFKKKTGGVPSYFLKLKKGKFSDKEILTVIVKNAIESPDDGWLNKKDMTAGGQLYDFVKDVLWPMLVTTEKKRRTLARLNISADITLRHINQLRLLNSIETEVRNINDEANRFLLSDTQFLLGSLIEDSDTPFIYEKIGTQLDHVMIDEFQDTGTVQWRNFKVLLDETISRSATEPMAADGITQAPQESIVNNMLVGDVKQSIYRWRSGDWHLLNGIETIFPHGIVGIRHLKTNYRSCRNIIKFNNAFFRIAARLTADEMDASVGNMPMMKQEVDAFRAAYDDVEQLVPDGKPADGFVEIDMLPKDNYEEATLEKTAETIKMLLAAGAKESDMAIIARERKVIQIVADYFTQNCPEIHIVSDEAFKLDASQAVCIIICAMKQLVNPSDLLNMATLVKLYQKLIVKTSAKDSELLSDDWEKLYALLPEKISDPRFRNDLLTRPLTDIVEAVYSVFSLDKLEGQGAYVCAFYDEMFDYLQDNTADITSFLKAWDEEIHDKAIQISEIDGIRLLTIHKSKGLEFKNVFMPFCDWKLENYNGNIIWSSPSESPFGELPLIPVDYSSKLMGTVFEKDYAKEYLQNAVDNINLLYVAFTRAGNNLFVIGQRGAGGTRSRLIEQSLAELAESLNDGSCELSFKGETPHVNEDKKKKSMTEPLVFKYGSVAVDEEKQKNESNNVFMADEKTYELHIANYRTPVNFRQSNKSHDFIASDDDDKQKEYISMGILLHSLFSTIRTKRDIETALRQLEFDGVIYSDEISRERLIECIRKSFNNKMADDWFSDRWTVFNECSILLNENGELKEYRPDRVMHCDETDETVVVDFKFGKENKAYFSQVAGYMKLLQEMGYNNVHGFLWYVYSDVIKEVKMSDN